MKKTVFWLKKFLLKGYTPQNAPQECPGKELEWAKSSDAAKVT